MFTQIFSSHFKVSLTSNQPRRDLLDTPIHRLMDELSANAAANLQKAYVSQIICVALSKTL